MPESSSYRNPIDKQLSRLAEGDMAFKRELINIYREYMHEIQHTFAQQMRLKNQEALGLLHHRHKTTCHVLGLQELAEALVQARDLLEGRHPDRNEAEALIRRVTMICHATLTQLNDI